MKNREAGINAISLTRLMGFTCVRELDRTVRSGVNSTSLPFSTGRVRGLVLQSLSADSKRRPQIPVLPSVDRRIFYIEIL